MPTCRTRTTTRSPASSSAQLGRAAEPGDEVSHDGIVFRVDSVDGQRIERLTVTFGWRHPAVVDEHDDG